MSELNLMQRMSAITAELGTVAKNISVATGKGKSYKAVSERDIIDAVKPLEAKHGVYSYPGHREILQSEILETETEYGKKTTFFERIKTTYIFVNVDDPKDRVEMTTYAEGLDSGDKASGKAMTYGDKYALMKAYKISTGEDPDEHPSEERRFTEYKRTEIKCERCGKVIEPYLTEKGNRITAEAHANRSIQRFNHIYCLECINRIKAGEAGEA